MAENPETFPAGPWTWRAFGGPLMLTTSYGGAKVVLAAGLEPDGRTHLMARDADGVLEPLTPDHPVARLIAAAPDLLATLEAIVDGAPESEPEYDDWGGDTERAENWGMEQEHWRLAQIARAAIAKAGASDG